MPVVLEVGGFRLADTLGHLVINDGLMTIFFFVVGLEIKREIVGGELASPRKAVLPLIAALGGMVAPALVYLAFQWGQPGQRGGIARGLLQGDRVVAARGGPWH